MKRPLSLSILGWFIIVASAISLVSMPLSLRNPAAVDALHQAALPIGVLLAISIVSGLLNIAAGIGILKGLAWGRILYIVVGVTGIVISLVSFPSKAAVIPGLILLAVFVFILFRPRANAYFQREAG